MKKRVVQALGCLLAMTMVAGSLTACGGKSEKKAEKKEGSDVKVAIICSAAGQNDNGYNQSAVEGAKKLPMNLELNIRLSSLQQVYHRRWNHWLMMDTM